MVEGRQLARPTSFFFNTHVDDLERATMELDEKNVVELLDDINPS